MTSDRMQSGRGDRALAAAVASLVARPDVADALAHLLGSCVTAYGADAVAVLMSDQRGGLELLSSTSHKADELELLQIQSATGPCVDALTANDPVFSTGTEMVERWGAVGEAILARGYGGVHAYPMHWRGVAVGGLNLFIRDPQPPDVELGQMFADLATLIVLQSNDLSTDQLVGRVHEAVSSRAVIEQAKGVLAYRLRTDMDSAYAHLLNDARRTGVNLTALAGDVIRREHSPQPDADQLET